MFLGKTATFQFNIFPQSFRLLSNIITYIYLIEITRTLLVFCTYESFPAKNIYKYVSKKCFTALEKKTCYTSIKIPTTKKKNNNSRNDPIYHGFYFKYLFVFKKNYFIQISSIFLLFFFLIH